MRRALHGWIPDRPDQRDRLYSELRPRSARIFSAIARPSSAYVRADCLPLVLDQGPIGSCTGHGTGEIVDFAEAKEGHRGVIVSRLHIYFHARGGVPEDRGASIRDAVKAVARFGVPQESLWPYDVKRWAEQPSIVAEQEGMHRANGLEYFRLQSNGSIQDCIAQGFPVVFGTTLFQAFEDVGADGKVPMPGAEDAPIGGHCMAITGYASKVTCPGATPGAFYVRNSWGRRWGAQGSCWLAYDYVRKFASDFWTIRRVLA